MDGEDRQALLRASDEFNNEVGRLDEHAKAIKDKNWPNPTKAVLNQLTQLDNQKNAIVTAIVRRMLSRMSAEGNSRFQQHVGHVKTRVKMSPPTALPTPHHTSE